MPLSCEIWNYDIDTSIYVLFAIIRLSGAINVGISI